MISSKNTTGITGKPSSSLSVLKDRQRPIKSLIALTLLFLLICLVGSALLVAVRWCCRSQRRTLQCTSVVPDCSRAVKSTKAEINETDAEVDIESNSDSEECVVVLDMSAVSPYDDSLPETTTNTPNNEEEPLLLADDDDEVLKPLPEHVVLECETHAGGAMGSRPSGSSPARREHPDSRHGSFSSAGLAASGNSDIYAPHGSSDIYTGKGKTRQLALHKGATSSKVAPSIPRKHITTNSEVLSETRFTNDAGTAETGRIPVTPRHTPYQAASAAPAAPPAAHAASVPPPERSTAGQYTYGSNVSSATRDHAAASSEPQRHRDSYQRRVIVTSGMTSADDPIALSTDNPVSLAVTRHQHQFGEDASAVSIEPSPPPRQITADGFPASTTTRGGVVVRRVIDDATSYQRRGEDPARNNPDTTSHRPPLMTLAKRDTRLPTLFSETRLRHNRRAPPTGTRSAPPAAEYTPLAMMPLSGADAELHVDSGRGRSTDVALSHDDASKETNNGAPQPGQTALGNLMLPMQAFSDVRQPSLDSNRSPSAPGHTAAATVSESVEGGGAHNEAPSNCFDSRLEGCVPSVPTTARPADSVGDNLPPSATRFNNDDVHGSDTDSDGEEYSTDDEESSENGEDDGDDAVKDREISPPHRAVAGISDCYVGARAAGSLSTPRPDEGCAPPCAPPTDAAALEYTDVVTPRAPPPIALNDAQDPSPSPGVVLERLSSAKMRNSVTFVSDDVSSTTNAGNDASSYSSILVKHDPSAPRSQFLSNGRDKEAAAIIFGQRVTSVKRNSSFAGNVGQVPTSASNCNGRVQLSNARTSSTLNSDASDANARPRRLEYARSERSGGGGGVREVRRVDESAANQHDRGSSRAYYRPARPPTPLPRAAQMAPHNRADAINGASGAAHAPARTSTHSSSRPPLPQPAPSSRSRYAGNAVLPGVNLQPSPPPVPPDASSSGRSRRANSAQPPPAQPVRIALYGSGRSSSIDNGGAGFGGGGRYGSGRTHVPFGGSSLFRGSGRLSRHASQ